MLNPFPELLTFGLLAPFLIRIVLAVIYIHFSYSKLMKERGSASNFFAQRGFRPGILFVWIFGLVGIIGGLMLLVGIYTQIASLILTLLMLAVVVIKAFRPTLLAGTLSFYALIFIATLSLLFSGAGAFAFDLPL